jgi:hypothetical protein
VAELAEPSSDVEQDILLRRTQVLMDSLHRRNICAATFEEADDHLRSSIAYLITLAHNPPHEMIFQDARSIRLLDEVEALTLTLDQKLAELDAYGDEDTGSKVNLCQAAFYREEVEQLRGSLLATRLACQNARAVGIRPSGRGRQPLHVYYEFVRQLHEVYEEGMGRKGYSEKNGTAEGDFVDLVFEAQSILPGSLQGTNLKTVGSRVLSAFADLIPEK